MIPLSGTFDYLATIPEARSGDGFECRAETRGLVAGRRSAWQMPGWSACHPRFA